MTKVLACVFLLLSLPALAEDRPRARAMLKDARQHYNLGEYESALKSFREAYRNYEDPSFLFNIGQCERQLGHKADAVHAYRAYLNNAKETPNRAQVNELITSLEREIAEESKTQAQPPTGVVEAKPEIAVPSHVESHVDSHVDLVVHAPAKTPAYKKWWVWTVVGVVVAGGVATGLGVGLTQHHDPTASTSLGTVHPF